METNLLCSYESWDYKKKIWSSNQKESERVRKRNKERGSFGCRGKFVQCCHLLGGRGARSTLDLSSRRVASDRVARRTRTFGRVERAAGVWQRAVSSRAARVQRCWHLNHPLHHSTPWPLLLTLFDVQRVVCASESIFGVWLARGREEISKDFPSLSLTLTFDVTPP